MENERLTNFKPSSTNSQFHSRENNTRQNLEDLRVLRELVLTIDTCLLYFFLAFFQKYEKKSFGAKPW